MTYQQLINYGKKLAKSHNVEVEGIKILVLEMSGLNGAEFLLNIHSEVDIELEEIINQTKT